MAGPSGAIGYPFPSSSSGGNALLTISRKHTTKAPILLLFQKPGPRAAQQGLIIRRRSDTVMRTLTRQKTDAVQSNLRRVLLVT